MENFIFCAVTEIDLFDHLLDTKHERVNKELIPYKQTKCIPRLNDVENTVSTSFQRGIHVVCLFDLWSIRFPLIDFNNPFIPGWTILSSF